MAPAPILVYLYGPPAVGKLTVATELQQRTGFRLFHNHLTVNALREVFDFGSDAFTAVLHRTRLDVFETAASAGVSVIFTNNSAWPGPTGRRDLEAFATQARERTRAGGGRIRFVQLTAPTRVLESRLGERSRHHHGKLTDRTRLLELLAHLDPSPLHPDDLCIDTSLLEPSEAADAIAAAIESPA